MKIEIALPPNSVPQIARGSIRELGNGEVTEPVRTDPRVTSSGGRFLLLIMEKATFWINKGNEKMDAGVRHS